MKSDYEESIFIQINLNRRDKLLVGCLYRSESGTEDNNSNLRKLIREATAIPYSHIQYY